MVIFTFQNLKKIMSLKCHSAAQYMYQVSNAGPLVGDSFFCIVELYQWFNINLFHVSRSVYGISKYRLGQAREKYLSGKCLHMHGNTGKMKLHNSSSGKIIFKINTLDTKEISNYFNSIKFEFIKRFYKSFITSVQILFGHQAYIVLSGSPWCKTYNKLLCQAKVEKKCHKPIIKQLCV